jgi:hypothetical protein
MRPFLGQEAVARGELSTRELRTHVQRVYRNVYIPQSAVLTAADRARAAWLWCGGEAALVGLSAAAIHGAKWIDANLAAEICRPDRRHPPGIKVRTFRLPPDDVCWVDDMRLTTPERTAFDIGRLLLPDRSVPILDALVQPTSLSVDDVSVLAECRPRGARSSARTNSACLGRRRGGVTSGDAGPSGAGVSRSALASDSDLLQRRTRCRAYTSRYGMARLEGRRGVRRDATLGRCTTAVMGH